MNANQLADKQSLERAVLAGCLAGAEGLDDAAAIVIEDDFTGYAHRHIFRTCVELRRQGMEPTAHGVFSALTAAGLREELGGNPGDFLAEILESDPTGALAGYNASLLRKASVRFALRRDITVLAHDLETDMPVEDLLSAAERALFALRERLLTGRAGPRAANEFMLDALQRLDDRRAGRGPVGLNTGFQELDRVLVGLRPTELIILAARPSVGKSALAEAIAVNVAAQAIATNVAGGTAVLHFSLEMGTEQIADRLLAMHSGVPMNRIARSIGLSETEVAKIASAGQAARALPYYVEDSRRLTADQLAAIARRYVHRHQVGLIVVDYLHLLEPENPREKKYYQIGLIGRRLLQLAGECNIPVLALAQLNRDPEDRPDGKPKLSDLRDSGELEQDANVVVFLSRPPKQADEAPNAEVWSIDVNVAKNRNGPTGEFTMNYRRPCLRFEDYAPLV